MKILVAGFKGNNNSSKILLDNLPNSINKLYLENDKEKSVNQLLNIATDYDIILAFGQKPVLKNKISVERKSTLCGNVILSDFDFESIENFFADKYPLKFSDNAGTSYCNHLYYHALKKFSKSQIKIVFIHIPMLKNISNILSLICAIKSYIDYLTLFNKK